VPSPRISPVIVAMSGHIIREWKPMSICKWWIFNSWNRYSLWW
jgi:hypothetical protein